MKQKEKRGEFDPSACRFMGPRSFFLGRSIGWDGEMTWVNLGYPATTPVS